MTRSDEWSPDEQLGAEAFEQGDEALDEASRVNPRFIEEVEEDPSLDPALQVDVRELEEVGAELDDPEALVTLDGGIDDPDGLSEPTSPTSAQGDDSEGWKLDTPLTRENRSDGAPED
jgi:hypothetical protein